MNNIMITRVLVMVGCALLLCLSARAFAAECAVDQPCQLFSANPIRFTGPVTSPAAAQVFDTTEKEVDFDPQTQRAVISSTSSGQGRIVIDNFLTINDRDRARGGVCQRAPQAQYIDSCFGPPVNRDRPPVEGAEIDTVLTRIPPVDVSAFLDSGTTTVRFDLFDFGTISGNTELWLVILRKPEVSLEACRREVEAEHGREVAECRNDAKVCERVGEYNCEERRIRCEERADENRAFGLRRCEATATAP
jgi:hypothetical protein